MGTKTRYQRNSPQSLFGHTRSSLLAMIYGHSEDSFYLRQLIRAIGSGHGALQRELKALTALGLIVRRPQGNQVLYQANTRSPIFAEIRSLIAKTVGVREQLHSALLPLGAGIQVAFVFGSVARQDQRANSDIDLLVLGEVPFSEVVSALGEAQRLLGREINPSVFPIPEFQRKIAAGNHFLRSLMNEKKLFVIGTEDEFARLGSKQLAGPARNKRK